MTNPLATATSTYLRQHAGQPVAWLPWGDAALARAQREDKPILLSIGYAACHWCHVMAHESFNDAATAALMNEGFINVKVDREERPDLDQVYQQAHQLLRRSGGGWPLTIFLSPQGMPFYSGTYFPALAQADVPAFGQVLASVRTVWREQREALGRQDLALRAAFAASLPRGKTGGVSLDASVRDAARAQLAAAFDAVNGGFGDAPKFAHPTDLAFLLHRGRDEGDEGALQMALFTLRRMAEGGLFDQIGGGFFRYSVDAQWQLPHFEKMLCDNAVLLALYADALALTGEPLLRRVVEDTTGWALREMQGSNGGFHASLSADDAKGREGHGYVWASEPLRLTLSPNEWDVCAAHWGLVDAPGFEGRWHLRVARSATALATTLGRPQAMVEELIASAREKLLKARETRDSRDNPVRDDKQLTSWNALMISGLARAAAVCQRADWLQAARAALAFVKTERWQAERQLLLGVAGQGGFLDDHAFLLEAVLALHAADPQADDLSFAQAIAEAMLAQFEDRPQGGFFFTRHDAPALIHRPKTGIDAATPSGNGTAARALQALGRLVDEPRYFAAADRCVAMFAEVVRQDPASHTRLLQAALSA
jgi:uncharacterized protein